MKMNTLSAAIRLYQRSPLVNTAVRLSVRAYHRLTPDGAAAPCPYPGQCSATGLAAANTTGMAALGPILSRMAACRVTEPDCKVGTYDPDCNHIAGGDCRGISGGYHPGCAAMPHPMDPTDGCTSIGSHGGSPKGC